MNCQRCRKWMEDAALGALEASRLAQLKAHLTLCPQCREAYEAEQRLSQAIDRGIAASVEGAPPAQFAAGVRTRLNGPNPNRSGVAWERGHPGRIGATRGGQDARAPRWWRPAVWSPALGLAALAVLLSALWFVRRSERPRVPERARVATPGVPAQRARVPEQTERVAPPAVASLVERPHRPLSAPIHRVRPAPANKPDREPQLQVLIDPGQAQALAELVRTMRHGADPVGTVEKSVQNEDPLQVETVQVNAVTIAELQTPKPIGPAADEGKSQ